MLQSVDFRKCLLISPPTLQRAEQQSLAPHVCACCSMPSTIETSALISQTVAQHIAAGDPAGLAVGVALSYFLRAEILEWPFVKAFELLGEVPGLQAKLPRYVIFAGAASGGALLYFLLHDAADLSTGAHVAIMLAFAGPLAMLVYAVVACSRGAEDEAEAKGLAFTDVTGTGEVDDLDGGFTRWESACKVSGYSGKPYTVEKKTDWASARKFSGLKPCTAALVAATKLVFWHWLQPAAYLFALVVYWGEIDTTSRWLGAIVGVREAIYLVSTIVALFVQPAYLLVSTGATLRNDKSGAQNALVLIFMPDKFVMMSLHPLVGHHFTVAFSLVVLPVLDLVAIAALVVAILPEEPFPPPLLVGYALTALGGVTFVLLFVDDVTCQCTERLSKALL